MRTTPLAASRPAPRRALALLTLLAAAGAHAQPGSIIIAGDEWMLSNAAFTAQPLATTTLADNVASCFDNGGPANFAIFGNAGFAYGSSFIARMQTLGHTVTVLPSGPYTLATYQQYDAVFHVGFSATNPTSTAALTSYVNGGGHVMVMAGTTGSGTSGATAEANAWAPFLSNFGLGFGPQNFGFPPNLPTPLQIATTPLPNQATFGVNSVTWSLGQTALDIDPTNPLNQVALWGDFTGVNQPPLTGPITAQPIIATWNVAVPAPGPLSLAAGGLLLMARRRR